MHLFTLTLQCHFITVITFLSDTKDNFSLIKYIIVSIKIVINLLKNIVFQLKAFEQFMILLGGQSVLNSISIFWSWTSPSSLFLAIPFSPLLLYQITSLKGRKNVTFMNTVSLCLQLHRVMVKYSR
jgi:hypothetical protein